MQLTRIYYPVTIRPGGSLDVSVTSGDPVQYGTTALPFQADGELRAGDVRIFDQTFVLNVPGQSDVDVGPTSPPPPPEAPAPLLPDDVPGAWLPNEAEMRSGGVTAVEGKERPE